MKVAANSRAAATQQFEGEGRRQKLHAIRGGRYCSSHSLPPLTPARLPAHPHSPASSANGSSLASAQSSFSQRPQPIDKPALPISSA